MAQLNPSPTKPIVSYPTASIEDKELVTLHDTRLPDYKPLEYGTPFKDQAKFPGLKLVHQEPFGEDDRMVRRIWAGDRRDQDLYNADRKYSGGSMEHPIIIRRYIFPEEGYVPVPTGTPDTQFSDAVLVDEEVTQPENRIGYISVTRVYETVPGPILTGVLVTEKGQLASITTQTVAPNTTVTASALTVTASVKPDGKGKSLLERVEVPEVFDEKSFAIENPDPVPQKFRIAAPSTTIEETVVGTAAQPSLATGELAASEQQVTKFTKRNKKTSRSTTALPVGLPQTATTNSGLKAAVVETLQVGDTTDTPSATVSVESEAMGDGTYVVRKTTLPEVFDEKSFAIENPDPVPQKFRIAAPSTTTEETVVGTAAQPSLATGELAASEQQVTKFTKRNKKTSRSTASLPKSLTQTATTNIGLKAAVVETLQVGDTSDTPSATVSVESEAMGDGTYVVRKTTLPEVFDEKAISQKKPEVIPERFRAAVPDETTSEIKTDPIASALSLASDEVSKTEQRLTNFTKRVETVKRSVPNYPQLDGQTYDEVLDENIEYTESISTTKPATKGAEATPLSDDDYLVKTLDIDAVKQKLKNFSYDIETEVNISLPDRLEGFQVHWETGESEGGAAGDPVETMFWTTYSGVTFIRKQTDTASAQATIRPTFSYTLIRGYKGPAIATEHIRFVEDPDTFSASAFGGEWPIWIENGGTIVLTGHSKTARKVQKSVTSTYYSPGPGGPPSVQTGTTLLEDSTSGDISYHVAQIPPCLHGQITATPSSHAASASRGSASVSVSVNGNVQGSIAATNPPAVQGGTYVVSKSFTPYKYGLWKVSVVSVDISPYI